MKTASISLGLMVALAPLSASAGETIQIQGVAAIVDGDVAHARDRAIDDAKRKAIEQVAGAHISSQSVTANFQLVEDRIYARASGFVKKYEILNEYKEEGLYKVKLKAEVDKGSLVERLDLIFREKPRVIVMVAEQNVGSKDPSFWWGNSGFSADLSLMQNTLIAEWQPRGYKFVDPGMLAGDLKVQGAMRKPELSNAHALRISKDADADIVLVGKVLVNDAGPVMDGVKMHSYHAVATLRVLNVDTGEIIAVADDTGAAASIDPNLGGRMAIKALAKKLSSNLETKILAKWTEEAASARELELVLEGVKNSKMVRTFEDVLREEVRGVESVRTRRRKGKKAYLTVRVRANSTDFARDLESKKYGDFSLSLKDVSRAKVVVSLK